MNEAFKKRKAVLLLSIITGTVLLFYFLLALNNNSPRIFMSNNNSLRVDVNELCEEFYKIETPGKEILDNSFTYYITLQNVNRSDYCIYIPYNSISLISINDAPAAENQVGNYQLYNLPFEESLKENVFKLSFSAVPTYSSEFNGIFLSTVSAALNMQQTILTFRMITIGISIAVTLYSLSLFLFKASEKYLLIFLFYAYTTMIRSLVRIFPALQDNPISYLITLQFQLPFLNIDANNSFYYLSQTFLLGVLRYLLLGTITSIQLKRRSYVSYSVILSFIAFIYIIFNPSDTLGASFCISALNAFFYLGELYYLIKAYKGNQPEIIILSISWVLSAAFWMILTGCSHNWILHGTLNTLFSLRGIFNTIYTIGFMFAISGKFAKKFTEAEQLARELEKIQARLETLVDERSQELRLSYTRLKESQDQKSALLSNIMHSLKTPLFSLKGYTDILEGELINENKAARRCLEIIQKNTIYIQNLIEKLFLSTRLEDGKINFNNVDFDMKALLHQAYEIAIPQASEKGIRILYHAPESAVLFNGDFFYLRQAVQNILDNAIVNSDSNSEIDISLLSFKEKLIIILEDKGYGISDKDLPHIFDRYYSSSRNKRASSGLGLSIAKDIISYHKGEVLVESKLGEGSRFTIILPDIKYRLQVDTSATYN